MNIRSLLQNLANYPPDTEIKIIVNDKEEDIRCLIFDKDKATLFLADSSYECWGTNMNDFAELLKDLLLEQQEQM